MPSKWISLIRNAILATEELKSRMILFVLGINIKAKKYYKINNLE
jgi:hypothetical protein